MADTLKDQLYEVLRNSINKGVLEPGLVLLESRLAKIFSMSRSPVRDTLNRLNDEGLVCRFDGRGFLVGSTPGRIVRREIRPDELEDPELSIDRSNSWLELACNVERDTVLCSMVGRWEINELKLAKELGVSRAITQQILLQLQYIGVVEREKYAGWEVVPLNDQRLQQLYEARALLEPFMIRRATERIPKEVLDSFMCELDAISQNYPNVDAQHLDALEHQLHSETLKYGGNDEIVTMLGRTRPILLVSKHLLGDYVQFPSVDPFLEEHREIFNLMLARQGDKAAEALRTHLLASEVKVQHRLTEYRQCGVISSPEYLRWVSDD